MNKQQVIVIGGGETFDTHEEYLHFLKYKMIFDPAKKRKLGWKENLQKDLGRKYEVINVAMPNKLDAKYEEWKIYFNNVVPRLNPGTIFVGHSLGGLFLLKYIGESSGIYRVLSGLMLVSTPFALRQGESSWNAEGFADFPLDLEWKIDLDPIHMFHSNDDTIVPVSKSSMILSSDEIHKHTFENRGHFIHDTHFPELVSTIRAVARQTQAHEKKVWNRSLSCSSKHDQPCLRRQVQKCLGVFAYAQTHDENCGDRFYGSSATS